jgi:hypothetical protein
MTLYMERASGTDTSRVALRMEWTLITDRGSSR